MAARWFRQNRKGTVYLGIGGNIYRLHLELWRLGITWEFNHRKRRRTGE